MLRAIPPPHVQAPEAPEAKARTSDSTPRLAQAAPVKELAELYTSQDGLFGPLWPLHRRSSAFENELGVLGYDAALQLLISPGTPNPPEPRAASS